MSDVSQPVSASPAVISKRDKNISVALFVIRCTLAGVLAYMIPKALGAEYPVWAAMAAVHIAREPLNKTHKETIQRVAGTIFGSFIGLAVVFIAIYVPIDIPVQMGIAIAICSLVSAYYPLLHISMWTCLSVMLKPTHDGTHFEAGLWRSGEVIFGALLAVVVHASVVWLVRYIRKKRGIVVPQEVLDLD